MNSVFLFCFPHVWVIFYERLRIILSTFLSLFVVRIVGKRRLLRTTDAATLHTNVSFFFDQEKKLRALKSHSRVSLNMTKHREA